MALTKHPRLPDNCLQPVGYSSAGRTAFEQMLRQLNFSEDKKLLLPAYIGITDREGSGVFDPVESTKTPYEFYSLDRKLAADKNELIQKIGSSKFGALLVIHYYGFAQNDMHDIANRCREKGVVLIEDCAHSMYSHLSGQLLGTIGDVAFYSIHKFLAADDGGMLRVNTPGFFNEEIFKFSKKPTQQSVEMAARADLDKIRKKRRQNYLGLLDGLGNAEGIDVFYPDLPLEIAPHNFPVLVSHGLREKLYFKLIDAGVPAVALYYRIIAPITADLYPDSHFLSQNILNLPVHQDIESNDIVSMIDKVKTALKQLAA